MESKRNISLDIAKGLCLFLVVISHGCGIPYFGNIIFAAYVSAFYVILGYTSKDSFDKLEIIKRFKRLIIPYFIYNFILIVIYVIYSLVVNNFSIEYVVKGIFGIFYSRYAIYPIANSYNVFLFKFFNSPTWFLTSMFVTVVVYSFTLKYLKNKSHYAIFAYLLISYILSKLNILLPWSLDTCFFTTSLMLFGNFARRYKLFEKKLNIKYLIGLIVTIIVYIILFKINGNINLSVRIYGNSICLCFLLGIFGTIIFTSIAKIIELFKIKTFFTEMNANTTFILCMHFSMINILNKFFPFNIENRILSYIADVIKIIIIIILYIILNRIINKLYSKKYKKYLI